MHAAEHYGVEALGVTLSGPQADLANERIRAAGLEDRCRVEVRDFREVSGTCDKGSSIGMFEHLTEGALPGDRAHPAAHRTDLAAMAYAAVHVTDDTAAVRPPRRLVPMAYIPDCELLPISTTLREAERRVSRCVTSSLREHYALTVSAWRSRLGTGRDRAVEHTDESRAEYGDSGWQASHTGGADA
jgi:cyclopropane-fatty-acyl-phospholipid synthase